jgi:hypothetical protein
MTLNDKQVLFTSLLGQLLQWCDRYGYPVILAEAYRTPEQAALYAKQGKGIKNSVHTKKLAADLFAVVDGRVTWEHGSYEPIGRKWKSLHELCRWGGDFKNRDCVHFSLWHNGIM